MTRKDIPELHEPAFKQLLDSCNWADLADNGQVSLENLGLDGFTLKMQLTQGMRRPQLHIVSTLPPRFNQRLRDADGQEGDPVEQHVKNRSIPLAWEIETLCPGPATIYSALKEFGIRSGWSVGACGENSINRIDVYSRENHGTIRLDSALLIFSCYVSDAARAICLRHQLDNNSPTLTEREQQCLRWSANGKTSNEIGAILGISPNTVYFHLKNAALKFNVYGTRHAISRAMELRLI